MELEIPEGVEPLQATSIIIITTLREELASYKMKCLWNVYNL